MHRINQQINGNRLNEILKCCAYLLIIFGSRYNHTYTINNNIHRAYVIIEEVPLI